MDVTTLILGAGAAGLFCAAHAGPGVLLIDHAAAPGEKIRISGGGRCNFTNIHCGPQAFLSQNPAFAISALRRYGPRDFLALIDAHGIAWHEKTLGQLFCDGKATQIVDMLTGMVAAAGADLWLDTSVVSVARGPEGGFDVVLRRGGRDIAVRARHLVVATGGKSIPKMGATGLAYQIAEDFGLPVVPPGPALVPLTFADGQFTELAGVSLPVSARALRDAAPMKGKARKADAGRFEEALLFTHRGLSGPAILQISSYWDEGHDIAIDLGPGADFAALLAGRKASDGRKALRTHLAALLPARLVAYWETRMPEGADFARPLAEIPQSTLQAIAAGLHDWRLRPAGTEGYRTAEVTRGGIDTAALSSQTMAVSAVTGLYFIGEAVDVTGWLGGYNFQWAWASGHAAGTAIAQAVATEPRPRAGARQSGNGVG